MSKHKEIWREWEDDAAEMLGIDTVKASGRLYAHKGDAKGKGLLIDCKDTQTDGYSVTETFWKELSTWARNETKEPAIAIRIEQDAVYEIAVVTEMWYAERHTEFVPDDQLKRQKQKKVTRKGTEKSTRKPWNNDNSTKSSPLVRVMMGSVVSIVVAPPDEIGDNGPK